MPRFVTVARTVEIPPGERAVFDIEGYYIAVFNVGGTYYAIEDICTHDDGPLAEGELYGFEIECPRHGARFDIRSGKVLAMPAVVDVPWFPTRVVDDEIQVGFES
ncbi:MAG: non-heme iron oxygenase ferredoxin subunit [Chloroflexi bacterium]|nr:MAG: non-heme iron oxygenase ferredoxin subunit [Chloroflexota bacterium]